MALLRRLVIFASQFSDLCFLQFFFWQFQCLQFGLYLQFLNSTKFLYVGEVFELRQAENVEIF